MRRTMLLLLILAALVVAPMAAYAQDAMPPVACGSLSDEDCDFLKESRAAMQALESYSADVNVDVSLANVPNLPADASFGIETTGSFVLNPDLNQRMLELQQADPADMMANMEEMLSVAADFYAETMFDLTVGLNLSDDLIDFLGAQAGLPLPSGLEIPMRLVDGIVYFNADGLAEATGDPTLSGWIGIDMVGALEQSGEQMLEQMQSGDMLDPAAMTSMLANMNANQAMAEQFIEYVEVERLDDAEVDGAPAAQFLYTFDLAGYVSSPEFIELLETQIGQQMAMSDAMGQEPPMSEEDLAMITEMLPMFGPMLLSGVQWETLATVGLDDGYLYSTETNVEWDLSSVASMAGAMLGADMGRPARGGDAAVFSMNVFAQNYDFGEEMEIEAPEDAQIVPLEEMQAAPTM